MSFRKYRYYIGIDCGTTTGYAIWDAAERRFLDVTSMKIHTAMDNIRMLEKEVLAITMIRVEDARLRKWFGKAGPEQLQGAGSIKRDCTIWFDFLTSIGAKFEMVAPKNNRTKMKAEAFRQITKWQHSTNEHARDAAMLVYGR